MIILRGGIPGRFIVSAHFLQLFGGVEGIIGVAFLYELGGIFGVDALGFAFTLPIGGMRPGVERTFVGLESAPGETVQDVLFCAGYVAALVGIFNAKDKVAFMLVGK